MNFYVGKLRTHYNFKVSIWKTQGKEEYLVSMGSYLDVIT